MPQKAQPGLAAAFDAVTDMFDAVRGRRNPLTPPLRIRLHIGPFSDPRLYRVSAERNLEALKELCGLQPDSSVLDIGCGSGRMAAALTRYLSMDGSYEGFDVARAPIGWCQHAITPRFPNFRFVAVDTFSQRYNPGGKATVSGSTFPYADNRFDVVFAGSVYTHMLPDEVGSYLRETFRVLRPGGISLATFCLLTDRTRAVVANGGSSPPLPYAYGDCQVRDVGDPASFIAQPEPLIRELYRNAGLVISDPVHFGSWATEAPRKPEILERYGFEQDIVLAKKP